MGLESINFLWIGTKGEIEEQLVPQAGLALETIDGGAIVGVPLQVRMKNVTKLTRSLGKVNRLLGQFRPDVLLLTGGYVNGPVAAVAWLRRQPIAIYLPDIEPGRAIKSLSRFAAKVACTANPSLDFFPAGKAVVTGYPVRQELRTAAEMSREEALAQLDLGPDRPTLFVFGGSRGARSINRALMAILPALLEAFQVIHLSGELDWPEIEAYRLTLSAAEQLHYRAYPYLRERMGAAYRSADLVLARAGASMLGECPVFGIPAILVPYPYAWRYQKVNADYLVAGGAAIRVNDEDLSSTLLETVSDLLTNQTKLAKMSTAAKRLDMPDAAENVARILLGLSKRVES
jgi:UDP-N-acetylglucosamine--N-acetylmuramyl-(pentapeptide) pyrophosphoryl-undecaprenol N-acetylglucosamine transferase